MPAFDGTGPQGMGSLSGRGMGPCGGGIGWRSCGCGLRRFARWANRPTSKAQKQDLEDYKAALAQEIQAVEKELQTLS